jgi:hypothetical protein
MVVCLTIWAKSANGESPPCCSIQFYRPPWKKKKKKKKKKGALTMKYTFNVFTYACHFFFLEMTLKPRKGMQPSHNSGYEIEESACWLPRLVRASW